ncbi:MAG: signal peptidase II [Synechococcaceae cyanobacterium]|nr:signal peptidase II [Synechococcaceae cyanobacterium]
MSPAPPRRSPRLRRWTTLSLAALVVAADQLSKLWAAGHLPEGVARPLLPGLLQLRRVANTGAAFSLFTGAPTLLALVSAAVSAFLIGWVVLRPPAGGWRAAGLALLLGGAAGNGIDRWRLGWVLDFLEFVPIRFPVFNLADVAINAAVVCLAIDLLRPALRRDG